MLKKEPGAGKRRLGRFGLVMTAVLLSLGLGGIAWAVNTAHSATQFTNLQVRTSTDAWAAAGTAWTDVPGSAVSIGVPNGQYRMFDTDFSAESNCSGPAGAWCSVRVVVVRPTGVVEELRPAAGTDFAFDSVGGEPWESNAVSRTSYYYSAGTYTIKVQAARVNGATSFRLDDWNFGVMALAP